MDFTFRFSPESSKGQEAWANFFLSSANEDVETTGSVALLEVNGGAFDTFGSVDIFGNPDFSTIGEIAFSSADSTETLGSVAFESFDLGSSFVSVSTDCFSSSDSGSSCCFVG